MARAPGRPHRQMSDGGRRAPRPPALAQTGRKRRCCHRVRGNLHSLPRRRLRAPGAVASPAAWLARTAVDLAAWPLQKKSAHRSMIILMHVSLRMRGQLALNSEPVETCVT
eukprot:6866061-Pyramimonas_sp.AAC.1